MTPIRHLARDTAGAMAPLFVVALAGMAGFAALSVDGSRIQAARTAMQSMADAGAIAGAVRLPDTGAVEDDAVFYADRNRPSGWSEDDVSPAVIGIGDWDAAAGALAPPSRLPDAVRVTVAREEAAGSGLALAFGDVLGVSEADLQATAVARAFYSTTCLLALRPTGRGISLDSNARLTAEGCDVRVNSTSGDSIRAAANAAFTASGGTACTAGGVSGRAEDFTPWPGEGCPAMADPLAGLAEPLVGACTGTGLAFDGGTHTLAPGVHCDGIDVASNTDLVLQPGLHVVKDGTFRLASNTTLAGDGVTLFLADGADLHFHSNATLDLAAPASGATAGILLFQSRAYAATHTIRSNAVLNLEGAIYMPTASLDLNSNSELGLTGTAPWTAMIVGDIHIDSHGRLILRANVRESDVPVPSPLLKISTALVQ